ncbi:hypothetical protein MTP99_004969 [Tenebrio molitor]|nr:hypothetical protein MTP99_004969 [Tenebrio molitor]
MTGEGDCSQNSTDPLEEEEIYLEDVNDDVTLSPKRGCTGNTLYEDFSNSSTVEFTTPTSSAVTNTPAAHKRSKQNDHNAFGQYVAERLQEMGVEQRSAKRRAIVLLLEDI